MVAKLSKDAFKAKIAEAKEKAKQGFNDFEPGQYVFKLGGYTMGKNNNGDDSITGTWVCKSEEENGKEFKKFFSVEKALGILLSEWRDLGYDTDQMEESLDGLIKWCKMITKEAPTVLASVFIKKGYPTMKIDERVNEDEGGAEEAEEAAPAPAKEEKKPAAKAAAAPAKAPAKAAAKAAPVEEVEEVSDVEEVTDAEEQEVEVVKGTKIKFTWKGAEKEGTVDEVDEANGKFKVLADNGGKPGKFPVTPEMITAVLG